MATQAEIAEHLDLSERKVRDVLQALEIDHREASIDHVRLAYIRDLREKAAGRGGDEHAALTKARTEQALADARMKQLTYHRELGQLVPVSELEPVLAGWAATARSEVQFAVEKLIAAIQSQHGIEIEQQHVDDTIQPALRAIGSYPASVAPDADEGGGGVGTAAA